MRGSDAVVLGAATSLVAAAGVAGALWWRRRSAHAHADPDSMTTLPGRYRRVRTLGRGAMATVYLADDLQDRQPVAIKTLSLGRELGAAERAEARSRFLREAEALRRLRHPDIVRILDAWEDAGLAFIVMDVLHGTDLVAHTRVGSLLPVDTVLRTIARVALALDHAHRLGILHRDVKPANVMWDREANVVKLTDFGIASLADAERTRTGALLGTPVYMSPEQMSAGRIDGRSDLFSLGVMLFELLTGALPYRDGSDAELLRQIAKAPAPDVRERRPDLPESLSGVIAVALQKRPEFRYADGRAFAEDLFHVAARLPAAPAPPAT